MPPSATAGPGRSPNACANSISRPRGPSESPLCDRPRLEPAARPLRRTRARAEGGSGRAAADRRIRHHRDPADRPIDQNVRQCRGTARDRSLPTGTAPAPEVDRAVFRTAARAKMGRAGARPRYIAVVGRLLVQPDALNPASPSDRTAIHALSAGQNRTDMANSGPRYRSTASRTVDPAPPRP